MHREFDPQSGANESRLKVAFKFVALTPGTTLLKSVYTEIREEAEGGGSQQSFNHWVRVIVLGDG